jgi:ketosteroid isomerase-like protein
MPRRNVDVVRALFAAHGRGDEARIRELLADDVVWHLPGSTPVSGTHHGPDALLDLWRREAAMLGGRVVPELHDVTASDRHVVVLGGGDLRRGEETLSMRMVSVYHVAGGRITECWLHVVHGMDAFERLWSSPPPPG